MHFLADNYPRNATIESEDPGGGERPCRNA